MRCTEAGRTFGDEPGRGNGEILERQHRVIWQHGIRGLLNGCGAQREWAACLPCGDRLRSRLFRRSLHGAATTGCSSRAIGRNHCKTGSHCATSASCEPAGRSKTVRPLSGHAHTSGFRAARPGSSCATRGPILQRLGRQVRESMLPTAASLQRPLATRGRAISSAWQAAAESRSNGVAHRYHHGVCRHDLGQPNPWMPRACLAPHG